MLCPTKLGPTGTQALNVELQNLLNPPQKGKPQLQSAARVFRVGDKVMQVRNNYEIVWNRIGGEQGVAPTTAISVSWKASTCESAPWWCVWTTGGCSTRRKT